MATTPTSKRWLPTVLVALLLVGCSDLLDVTNPGSLQDDDLNSLTAMPALVAGMSGDLSVTLSTTTIWGSVWSDDLMHSGTLGAPTVFAGGDLDSDQVGGWWNSAHRARWVAETGIQRMMDVMGAGFETSALAPRAYILAGYSNRNLGENVCNAVIDGGSATDFMDHFTRAEAQFTEALRLASALGETGFVDAARAGRAQVRAAQGDWSGAVDDAVQISIDFRFDAIYSLNTGRESHGWEGVTLTRGEYTVWGTPWYEVDDDPRIPWEEVLTGTGTLASAANGNTPWVRQQKYLSNANPIALAKGTEMRLIEAEAELRSAAPDVGVVMDLINEVRTFYDPDLAELTATSVDEAWPILQLERGKTLWLEGRRFWDLRRWYEETGAAHHDFLAGRDRCVPISDDERLTNPNLS